MARPTMGELQKLLTQVRRIAEHREKGSEQEIRRTYRDLLKDLRAFLGERYEKLAEDDKLDYAILQQKGEFAHFIEDVERLVVQHTEPAAQSIQKVVEDTYSLCWQGMQDAVKQSVDGQQLHTALQGLRGVTPEVVKQAVNNPISGLTLTTRLQKHRQDVIYGIKQQIGIGLTQGDTYTTMARRVAGEVDGDYQKAVRIVRTETHRVREAGFHDAAEEVHESAQQVGYGMAKTWRTMLDERVRPQHRYRRGKHWVTVIRGPYNHQKMEGVTVPVDQSFDLGGGVTTKAPGQSGVAGQDINCRCFLEYNLKKLENAEGERSDNMESGVQLYRPVTVDTENLVDVRRGARTISLQQVTSARNEVFLSKEVQLKPKQLHTLDRYAEKAAKALRVSNQTKLPPIYVISNAEMQTTAVAAYSPVKNVLYMTEETCDAEALLKLQKSMACPENPCSTILHELIHWQDAEAYRKVHGEIVDYQKYIEYVNEKARKALEKLKESGYNIDEISMYASNEYSRDNFAEPYTEYRVKQLLKE
ncbi:phage minor head protein [Caproicibacterium argilliputei]|uniref:Phage minor head protein n=1 Tax=Caproicibacterium argilliputei TaxID=3030016 RepID=A0AA97DC23_9FIRM|nr:phage minor head protein [Caproicibacterium argilliputei]WOC33044.1 phage minor head protein [Caproicibacterium argilliputei]